MDVGHEVISERADRRSGAWAGLRQLAGLWRVFLFTELAWLIISVVVLRFAPASVAMKPEETPVGGLTMAISLPAVPSLVAGQDGVELVAGADGELGEDLVQVVFDRAQAHE